MTKSDIAEIKAKLEQDYADHLLADNDFAEGYYAGKVDIASSILTHFGGMTYKEIETIKLAVYKEIYHD